MKYYTIQRPNGELVTICGELVAAADPINTPPAAALRTPPQAAPPARKKRGRPSGWTGNYYTAGRQAAAVEGCSWREIIRATCNACGINLTQLADALEVHPTAVSKWHTAKWSPNAAHAARLLSYYKASGACRLRSCEEVTT
jgi:hypothetical protein